MKAKAVSKKGKSKPVWLVAQQKEMELVQAEMDRFNKAFEQWKKAMDDKELAFLTGCDCGGQSIKYTNSDQRQTDNFIVPKNTKNHGLSPR